MSAVDHQALQALLLRLEARIHRDGWDEPPQLYVVYDTTHAGSVVRYQELLGAFGLMVSEATYAARPLMPAGMLRGVLPHTLYNMAVNVTFPPAATTPGVTAATFRRGLNQPGLRALALSCEAWVRIDDGQDYGGRLFADIPGSKEARMVLAVDIDGQSHHVKRYRGQVPEVDLGRPGGALPELLRYLVSWTAGTFEADFPSQPTGWQPVIARR